MQELPISFSRTEEFKMLLYTLRLDQVFAPHAHTCVMLARIWLRKMWFRQPGAILQCAGEGAHALSRSA